MENKIVVEVSTKEATYLLNVMKEELEFYYDYMVNWK